jgi:hypothetical protein
MINKYNAYWFSKLLNNLICFMYKIIFFKIFYHLTGINNT